MSCTTVFVYMDSCCNTWLYTVTYICTLAGNNLTYNIHYMIAVLATESTVLVMQLVLLIVMHQATLSYIHNAMTNVRAH
jgi:hypothetical protein